MSKTEALEEDKAIWNPIWNLTLAELQASLADAERRCTALAKEIKIRQAWGEE